MRVVFMGTPAFAVPVLDALLGHHEVVAVYTRPDATSGRGRRVVASPVKERALAAGVPVEQPATLRDTVALEKLTHYAPDLIAVAAYGAILPPSALEVPPLGCLNVHASLLPRWRGAAPIQRAILAGDDMTGVSIMRMEEGLDTGPWCLQTTVAIGDASAARLTEELASLGAGTLLVALEAMQRGELVWTPQEESLATYADKLTAADVALAPDLTVEQALRRVRASGPSAPSRLAVDGRRLVILQASRSTADLMPGEADCARDLDLGVSDGSIRAELVVPEGRSQMSGDAFVRGARLGGACRWSAS